MPTSLSTLDVLPDPLYALGAVDLQQRVSRLDLLVPDVPAGDTTPPVVALIEPADGGELDRFAAIVLEVTDETALGRVFVVARFPTLGVEEVVHQGDRFASLYTGASSRASITGGYRYSVKRNGGWPAPPVLTVYAPNAAVEV